METQIISVFPDCGKYNPIKLSNKFANIYLNRYRKLPNSSELNPDFPQNYIDIVEKCIGKFDVVVVSSNPVIRRMLAEKFPQSLSVIYFKGDKETKQDLIDYVNEVSGGKDGGYISTIERNWEHWHTEAELFCIENNIPFYEVKSRDEAEKLILSLCK